MITSDYSEAVYWSRRFLGNTIFIETWIPSEKFIQAEIGEYSLAISRQDNGIFGVAFGLQPVIPKDWTRFSIERRGEEVVGNHFTKKSEWDVFTKEISPKAADHHKVVSSVTDAEIASFLDSHAPESSVKPGDKEIVAWATVVEDNSLAGVAAIARWESGNFVVVSVAVDQEKRNLGIGTKVMEQIDNLAGTMKISRLCLGVVSSNVSAIRLYEKNNWSRIHQFSYFEATSAQ